MVKKAAIIFLLLSFTLSGRLSAEEAAKITTRTMKGISGEVSGLGKDFIAIVYRRDVNKGLEEEIAFPLAADVKIENKKNVNQIAIGDYVDVQFEEVTQESKEGVRSKRVAKVITFVRAAPPPKPSSSVLVTGASGDDEEGQ